MLDNKILIENIRRLCEEHNLKITNLEKELGFGAGIINRWGNDADPSLSKIIQVAEYFNVSLDEVVGRSTSDINDEFLKVIYKKTSNKDIQWQSFDETNDESGLQQFSHDIEYNCFYSQEEYIDFMESHKQISYYFEYTHGYISIYALYAYHNITSPSELKMFIQPDIQAELIPQPYETSELLPLWLKVLTSLDDNAPDEIKAEVLKNSFVNSKNQIEYVEYDKKELNQMYDNMMNNYPKLLEYINQMNTPEMQKAQQFFSDPNFIKMKKQTSEIIKLFQKLQKP